MKESAVDPQAAYEKLVDRLLASPHYGERWGRIWLDAARYADSDGFEKDKSRQVYFYRDWVIDALNRDLPYDQFIIEQIAGDLLPKPTQDQIVATGYLRNSMINEEGGIDPEQFRMEAMFDRMDAIGKGILGLTIQCTQCHDHKYDPISPGRVLPDVRVPQQLPRGERRRLHAGRTTQDAPISSHRSRRIENDSGDRNPDWRTRMHAWEAEVEHEGSDVDGSSGPRSDDTGGQKHYLLDGWIDPRPGLCSHQAHDGLHGRRWKGRSPPCGSNC